MTPTDLIKWQAHMGFTQQQAADALGVRLNTYQEMRRGESFAGKPRTIDHRTSLACAAIAAGIKPWAETAVTTT